MKFVIAGLGSIGSRHLRNLISLGERDIILYRSNLSTFSNDELKEFPVETNFDLALDHKPDAVIISNPTSLHLNIAIPAVEAGCHILLEKPISHSLERINDLKLAMQKSGSKILVGFQYRFHPTLNIAASLLARGEIGNPVSVRSHWGEYLPGWHPWEDFHKSYSARAELGGGVVLTLCHPFDYLSWLLGKPKIIWAETSNKGELGINVEDLAEILLRFPNEVLGSIHLDYIQKPASHNFEIIGTGGTLRWDNNTGILSIYKHNTLEWVYYSPPEGFERNWMFKDEMRHFISLIGSDILPLCTLDDGITALEIATQSLSFGNQ